MRGGMNVGSNFVNPMFQIKEQNQQENKNVLGSKNELGSWEIGNLQGLSSINNPYSNAMMNNNNKNSNNLSNQLSTEDFERLVGAKPNSNISLQQLLNQGAGIGNTGMNLPGSMNVPSQANNFFSMPNNATGNDPNSLFPNLGDISQNDLLQLINFQPPPQSTSTNLQGQQIENQVNTVTNIGAGVQQQHHQQQNNVLSKSNQGTEEINKASGAELTHTNQNDILKNTFQPQANFLSNLGGLGNLPLGGLNTTAQPQQQMQFNQPPLIQNPTPDILNQQLIASLLMGGSQPSPSSNQMNQLVPGLNDPTNLLNSLGLGFGGLDQVAPSLGAMPPNAGMNLSNLFSGNPNQMLNPTNQFGLNPLSTQGFPQNPTQQNQLNQSAALFNSLNAGTNPLDVNFLNNYLKDPTNTGAFPNNNNSMFDQAILKQILGQPPSNPGLGGGLGGLGTNFGRTQGAPNMGPGGFPGLGAGGLGGNLMMPGGNGLGGLNLGQDFLQNPLGSGGGFQGGESQNQNGNQPQ